MTLDQEAQMTCEARFTTLSQAAAPAPGNDREDALAEVSMVDRDGSFDPSRRLRFSTSAVI
jgi:hypothetical protein